MVYIEYEHGASREEEHVLLLVHVELRIARLTTEITVTVRFNVSVRSRVSVLYLFRF